MYLAMASMQSRNQHGEGMMAMPRRAVLEDMRDRIFREGDSAFALSRLPRPLARRLHGKWAKKIPFGGVGSGGEVRSARRIVHEFPEFLGAAAGGGEFCAQRSASPRSGSSST